MKTPNTMTPSLVAAAVPLISACLSLLVYICCRDKVVLYLFSKPWSRHVFFSRDVVDEVKPYDAFLSYSHHDADFVEQCLLPGLESPENPDDKFKCLIHTRDWNVGEMIPDQILHSVESSRRTIIVLSRNYIEAVWTKLEFRAAHTQALKDNTQAVSYTHLTLPTKA